MPLVDRKLVREMASRRHGNDVVVLAHAKGVEPLLGVYSKNCIKALEESLFAGDLSVQDFLSGLKARLSIARTIRTAINCHHFLILTPLKITRASSWEAMRWCIVCPENGTVKATCDAMNVR